MEEVKVLVNILRISNMIRSTVNDGVNGFATSKQVKQELNQMIKELNAQVEKL